MRGREYPELGERLYRTRLSSGLTYLAVPKPGFSGWTLLVRAAFGSVDTRWRADGETAAVPFGTAAVLAEALTGGPFGDELRAKGYAVDARVTGDCTEFSVQGAGDAAEAAELLLRMVTDRDSASADPAGACRAVEWKERERTPETLAMDGLRALLFAGHPMGEVFSGTFKGRAVIDGETLDRAYAAWYRPGSLALAAAGDLVPERVAEAAGNRSCAVYGEKAVSETPPLPPEEPEEPRLVMETAYSGTFFSLGTRYAPAEDGPGMLRQRAIASLTARIAAGPSSPLLGELTRRGVLPRRPDAKILGCGAPMLALTGMSRDPSAVCAAFGEAAADLAARGPEHSALERAVRGETGAFLARLDRPWDLCSDLAEGWQYGYDALTEPQIFSSVTPDELRRFAGDAITARRLAVAVVKHTENKEEAGKDND